MQPILADSLPHRGRAIAFAIALAMFAFLAITPTRHHAPRYRGHHHRLMHFEKCLKDRYIIIR